MRNRNLKAEILAQLYGPADKGEPLQCVQVGELEHLRYGKFTIGWTKDHEGGKLVIMHPSGRVSIAHMQVILETLAKEMMLQ